MQPSVTQPFNELHDLSKRLEEAEIISKMGFWELDLQTFQGKWSKGHLQLFGLQPLSQAPTFEMFMEFVHPEDRTFVRETLENLLKSKLESIDIEFRIQLGQGKTIHWMKEIAKLELDENGQPLRILGSIQDVTQAKLTEIELKSTLKALEYTAKTLEQAGRMAKIGGWELDLATGRVEMTSETQRIHEIDENYQPPLYDTGAQWFPPDAWPIVQAAVTRAIEQRKPYDIETPFITAKGRTIWVRVQGFPVIRDDKVTHLQGTFQDINERKQKDLETQWNGDAMGFGVWKYDPIHETLEWDKRMYALYDVKPEDFSGARSAWDAALSTESREKAFNELKLALRGEKEFNTEFAITLKSGETRHLATRGIVIRNERNEPTRMYGLNWDVTERVLREQELKAAHVSLIQSSKLASLGEMSAGVAHEINNPLAIILGYVDVLHRSKDNPSEFEAKIETIKKSCARIGKIVHGLKKFSRSSDAPTFFQSHKISEICNEAVILTEIKSRRQHTPVAIDVSTQAMIKCNEIEIEQVLVNLINNAIDAAQENSERWVKISVFEESRVVIIRVTDSGVGIPEAIYDKLFDPFFTTKKVGEGTGLGLSICKGILDDHKATITVLKDCPNTCFEIRFPKAESSVDAG